MILLPFQLVKDHYTGMGKSLSFGKKVFALSLLISILICLFGSFSNIWTIPWYYNFIYIVYAFGFGLLFTTLLYVMVDRYVEKGKTR
ncbi:hypothetical protein M8998_02280 [Sphingobacterium sp. lm-10]|uniref:hypothetical protein n=1 Tax=Sphingobacterium sp. lm-10 TaxID=2944904 RepID=UPI0020213A1B|nr:hypothetical protein [Sphingobacterium sp. lm-10]MCL7986760.1 hypothetical protein [Sphingobacterium sp. lm-10]